MMLLVRWRARRNLGHVPFALVRSFHGSGCACLPANAGSSDDAVTRFAKNRKWDAESLTVDHKQAKDFNRWKILPAATLNHVCLGSIFAWSVFNQPLMRLNGVVASAAGDWNLGDISITFSLVMGGFAWGAIFSRKLDLWGPRMTGMIGGASVLGGFSLASMAVATQNLYLLYLGGLTWGLANGISYVPPVATLIRWFPDRKGFASGSCILGYGGGAMIAAPLFTYFISHLRKIPEFAGKPEDLNLLNKGGSLFVNDGTNQLREVVVATAADLKSIGLSDMVEAGAYYVGTGSTGIAESFACLGVGYGLAMIIGSLAFRLPPPGYQNTVEDPLKEEVESHMSANEAHNVETHSVSIQDAMRSPQFWLLYLGFGSSITGAYGIISSGKLLLGEAFSANPMVTSAFTTTFVAAMSAANLSGRVFWPVASDYLAKLYTNPFYGRKYTYTTMWMMTPMLYSGMLWSVHQSMNGPSMLSLGVFSCSLLGIIAIFGGSTANRPPLVADIYGLQNLGVLTARQLSVVMPAAFLGPQIVAHFRKSSMDSAITDLTGQIDDAQFTQTFGASKENLYELIESKTVTVPRLLELLPDTVQDPTPLTYDNAIIVLGGLQLIAVTSNLLLKPMIELDNKKDTQ